MSYLPGENVKPTSARAAKLLVGKQIQYLLKIDIDRSGRGYFFPKEGIVAGVSGHNLAIDDPMNFHHFSDFAEIILV